MTFLNSPIKLKPPPFYPFCRSLAMALVLVGCVATAGLCAEFDVGAFPVLNEEERIFREALAVEESDPAKALATLRKLKGSPPLPADAVAWALARLEKGAGKSKEAQMLLEEVAADEASPYRVEALSLLATIAEERGEHPKAARHLRILAESHEEADERARALGRLLGALEKARDGAKAWRVAVKLWVEYAHLPEAALGEAYLVKASGDPFTPIPGEQIYKRGKKLLDKGGREEAVRTLTELNKRLRKKSKLIPKVNLALGQALHFQRRNEEALPPLEAASKYSRDARVEQQARFWKARTLFALNRGDEGARDLVKLADKYTGAGDASVWLYQAYRVLLGRSINNEAAASNAKLLKRYPSSEMALDVGWWDAWELYTQGKYVEAADGFKASVARAGRGWQHVRGLFWHARSLKKAGREGQAKSAFEALLKEYPVGYYARLGEAELAGRGGVDALKQLIDPRGGGETPVSSTPPGEADLNLGGSLARPAAYLRLGLPEAAKRLLKKRKRTPPAALWLLYWAEDFNGVVRGADCSWTDFPWLASGAEGKVGRGGEQCGLSYAPAYPASLATASRESDIHPHMVLAIARTESHFNADGYSSWEARGLMQFIPATASRVADKLKIEDFTQQDLFEPDVALRLGARHLSDLLDRFDGDVVSAVAAYNGGAAAVKKWREKFKGADTAEFVERIPFRETKRYVKKVLTALDAYDRLDAPGLWGAK